MATGLAWTSKDLAGSDGRTQLKLLYSLRLICLCYWRDSVALPFVMKRRLSDLLFRRLSPSVRSLSLRVSDIPPNAS